MYREQQQKKRETLERHWKTNLKDIEKLIWHTDSYLFLILFLFVNLQMRLTKVFYTIILCNFVVPMCSQSGRWSSFRKWVRFTGSRLVLVISFYFSFYLFDLLLIKLRKFTLHQVKQMNHILLKKNPVIGLPHSHHTRTRLTSLLDW